MPFQSVAPTTFNAIKVEYNNATYVGHIQLNRPTKSNAMSQQMWEEIPLALNTLQKLDSRCVVLSGGTSLNFCAGIDIAALGSNLQDPAASSQPSRYRHKFIGFVLMLQEAMSSLEKSAIPVIAACHGAVIGAGIDLITAADIRYATTDAQFSVKEVDLAITADMGTLARLPGIVGDGYARDLALTGRTFSGSEALQMGLVTAVYPDKASLLAAALKTAEEIASKPPIAVLGTKKMLLYQRDHSVQDGLEMVAVFNAAVLPESEDVKEVFGAKASRRKPIFSKL